MKPVRVFHPRIALAALVVICSLATHRASALTVTPTTDTASLAVALGGGGGLTINSTSIVNGEDRQFGTYTGFSSAPVIIGNGIVLSTGLVAETTAAFASSDNSPSTHLDSSGTAEYNAYGLLHITNFYNSNNVAALQVNFTLAAASQVSFDFVFGSVEYPVFVAEYSDAFLAFLGGEFPFLNGAFPTNQVVFDASGNPVQVGSTFAASLTTEDTNTSFTNPHGLMALTTTTQTLSAGRHTLIFELGDVNDTLFDSGVFISNLRASAGTVGTTPTNVPDAASTLPLLGLAIMGLGLFRRKLA